MATRERETIRQASPADLDAVLSLLDEAAAWLRKRGIEQWPERFSGAEDWRSERIAAYVRAGDVYLLEDDREPVATITLTDKADPDYADAWPGGPGDSSYIYRMAVRRDHAGRDLGTQLIDWAGEQAAARGHQWLRLDCHRGNQQLQQYYEEHGFERVATVVAHIDPGGAEHPSGETYERKSGALYQRRADLNSLFRPERQAMH